MTATLAGGRGEAELVVTDADTARALGSGDLPVLGTPRLAALMEQAACAAIVAGLPPESTTVGVHLDLHHVAASPIGATVRATATVESVDGRRVRFAIVAEHEVAGARRQVGTATHERVVVDRARFLTSGSR